MTDKDQANETTKEITTEVTVYKKPLCLRTHVGSGTLGKAEFELATCTNGALYVNIKGNRWAVILNVEPFVRAAIDILEKEPKPKGTQ